ncbi:ABC transporter permease [candidate division KSB1 bacterium]
MKRKEIPKIAEWIFEKFIQNDECHEKLGDYEEGFYLKQKEVGRKRALIWYWQQVILTIPVLLKYSIFWRIIMFKNYIKIAFRNIKRHKVYSTINISGLAVGMSCSILILLWIQDELSFDKFHKNFNNIYRAVSEWQSGTDRDRFMATTPYPLGIELKESFAEVIESARVILRGPRLIEYKDNIYYEDRFYFADQSLFKIFTFPLIAGDSESVFLHPNSVVFTESAAKKYFGNEDPVGKTVLIDNNFEFIVSGVVKDVPKNSHLQFDFVGNLDLLIDRGMTARWNDHMYHTYLLLREDVDKAGFEEKIKSILNDIGQNNTVMNLSIQTLNDIYLRSNYENDHGGKSEIRAIYVYIFAVIAIIVMLIACINFMHLATAQSASRAKEIGIRKIAGAYKKQLVYQFLGESMLSSLLALGLAFFLVYLLLPEFNTITGKNISMDSFLNSKIAVYLVVITVITGVISGSYPALYLSSFKPVNVIKMNFGSGRNAYSIRHLLLIVQFTLSIILLTGLFVVNKQVNYMQSKKLGIKTENIIYIRNSGALGNNYNTFKTALLENPDIVSVSTSSGIPTLPITRTTGVNWDGKDPELNISWACYSVDYDFIKTLELEIIKGRNFSTEYRTDQTSAYIVNETGSNYIGSEQVIGKKFDMWEIEGKIIGVVKDFHIESLHRKVEPFLMRINPQWNSYGFVLIKVNSDNLSRILNNIEDIYKTVNPDFPFQFGFLDEIYGNMYWKEKRVSQLFKNFTYLSIFILCMGLFGLSSFAAEKRKKELGIRKVLGATQLQLSKLIYKEFLYCILLANLISWPLGWLVMNSWLNNFAYRTKLDITIFIYAGIFIYVIAFLTMSYRSIKAACANPIDSLRYE